MVTKTTSYVFLTAFAGNALALQLISDIFSYPHKLGRVGSGGGTAWAIDVAFAYITYKIVRPQLKEMTM